MEDFRTPQYAFFKELMAKVATDNGREFDYRDCSDDGRMIDNMWKKLSKEEKNFFTINEKDRYVDFFNLKDEDYAWLNKYARIGIFGYKDWSSPNCNEYVHTYDAETYQNGIRVIRWIDPYTDINKKDNDIIREVYTNEKYQNHLRELFKNKLKEYKMELYQYVSELKSMSVKIRHIRDDDIVREICRFYIESFDEDCVFNDSIIYLFNTTPFLDSKDKLIIRSILKNYYFYGFMDL